MAKINFENCLTRLKEEEEKMAAEEGRETAFNAQIDVADASSEENGIISTENAGENKRTKS